MMVGARTAAWAKAGGWKNPYITDGLVAMWDGEWNAGGGVHDPNATVWKDLSETIGDATVDGGVWGNDCLLLNEVGHGAHVSSSVIYRTVELVFKKDNSNYGIFKGLRYSCSNVVRVNSDYIAQGNDRGNTNNIKCKVDFSKAMSVTFTKGEDSIVTTGAFVNGTPKNDGIYNDYWGLGYDNEYAIGGHRQFNRGMIGSFFAVRLYSRELSAHEIATNYAIDKARFNLPDAV